MSENLHEFDRELSVSIWRGDLDGGRFETYGVPYRKSQTILDVVTWVQQNKAPDLAYRFACRVGMCGSCAMMVNGKPMWTCRTHVDKAVNEDNITIEPLRNLPVIKDLVANMDDFFEKWLSAEGRFKASRSRTDPIELISPKSRERQFADAAIECINCGVCYASCDVVTNNADYLGPAALNRAWTLVNDVRDREARKNAKQSRLKAVSEYGGCHNCHGQQGCAKFCPVELNPTRSIAGLKRASAFAALKGEI